MDILISFKTTVGVVRSFRTVRDVAVDFLNQSIVFWLKNKKTPMPGNPGESINSRDINEQGTPNLALPGQFAYIKRRENKYKYHYSKISWNWSIKTEETIDPLGYTYRMQEYIFAGVIVPEETYDYIEYIGYNPSESIVAKVAAEYYNPNNYKSQTTFSEVSNWYDAGNPNYPEGGGEPPGTILGYTNIIYNTVSFVVSFGA